MKSQFALFPSKTSTLPRAVSVNVKGVPFTPMTYERLPVLETPREAHSLELCNGEYTVFGGHTTGFVSTNTAEYFRRGKWHTLKTLYPHDAGFAVKLRSGEVMLGGGYEKDFGVGQTWGIEVYDPATHRFSPRPILDQKRTHATAAEMADGSILVADNWYAPDALESYPPGAQFAIVKQPSLARSVPYVLLTAEDNAIIFGDMDNYGEALPEKGPWGALKWEAGFASENSFFRSFKAETGCTPAEWKQQQPMP